MITASLAQQKLVRQAGRAMDRFQLAHAYGHCSMRLDVDFFLVCAAKPMGLLSNTDLGTVVNIHEPLPTHILPEVRIHQAIYRDRAEIGGVIRAMPPITMALSCAKVVPKLYHGMGCYLAPDIGFWDDVQLLRSDEQAAKFAKAMGERSSMVMRGNGAVVASASLQDAAVLMWYLEDAARIEMMLRQAQLQHEGLALNSDEIINRQTRSGGIFERMWDYLTHGDVESMDG
jgi:HCOMODA/2-hydroxy-3-carboxy-muconic semialdehyde decarboxylase